MNSFMFAFGWASTMLMLGVLLRAKIPAFRSMLVPASVIGYGHRNGYRYVYYDC